MMECRNCGHSEADHPAGFLCHVNDCRCPGWVKQVKGVNDGS